MSLRIQLDRTRIADFCQRWRVREMAFFGSVLRDDFREGSDVDVMLTFGEEAAWSLFDLVTMQDELAAILGRDVDIVTRSAIEQSANPYRRAAILGSAEVVHAA